MRTTTILMSLAMSTAALALVPFASAERITGCVDGDGDDSDCFTGSELVCSLTKVDLSCIIVCVRECVPQPDCIAIRECDPNQ